MAEGKAEPEEPEGASEFPEVPQEKPNWRQALEILGVSNEDRDNKDKVRAAFRRLSLKYHPDKNPNNEEKAKQAFMAVTAAYHVLSTANFDYERWKENFTVPPMQSLEDVLQKAFEGADPMEIEQMLRARGDYRPHPEFGKNLSIPWSAGTRETPKFDVAGTPYTKTEALESSRTGKEVAISPGLQDEAMVVGKSAERPWERVGGVGWESSKPYTKPEKFPHLDSTSEHAPSAAEQMNDKGVELFKGKDYRGAWEAYTEAVRLQPEGKPVYRGNRAAAGLKLGRYRDAITDCERAIADDSSYVKAWIRLGQAHAGMDRKENYVKAKEALERALELDPGNKGAKSALKDVSIALEAEDSD